MQELKEDSNVGFLETCQYNKPKISQAANPNGRRSIKMVLHEIYPDTTYWNENGITYLEKYTRDNAESVKGMPLCAQFLDNDKETPYGHGMTGRIKNMPVFEDSVQVGVFENWSIEDLEIDGRVRRCLCAEGYINEARYPNFVNWIIEKINDGQTIRGSVEFVGTKENDGKIIYDGGWKEKGRIPMVYDYSGYCILGVRPSDQAATLVEMNQVDDKNKSDMEDSMMSEINEEMKAVLSDFKNEVIEAIKAEKNAEVNSSIEAKDAQIAELETKVTELNASVESKDAEIAELNSTTANMKSEYDLKYAEQERAMAELKSSWESTLAELKELKTQYRIAELNSALSKYTDEQKSYAQTEIDAFKDDPFSVEINSIVEKIDAASYRKLCEAQEVKDRAEINSKNNFDDIMANVDPIMKDNKVEDFDVFA